jgi:SAM-dependent methyltransferase
MISAGFSDHFSTQARTYARARPTYPPALFQWLAAECTRTECVWDCATGNGQAAIALADHFKKVVATDASSAQLAQAPARTNVDYRVATADCSGLPAASVDLVTVAQALHWFDVERFYAEARRVARPDALIAVWTYGRLQLDAPALDTLMQQFYDERIAPCWPPERSHIEDGYARLPFPFEQRSAPAFEMTVQWPLTQLLDYVRSWSATPAYIARHGVDPALELEALLAPLFGPAEALQRVRWPLQLRVGYLHRPA